MTDEGDQATDDEPPGETPLDRVVAWARANPIPAGLAGIGVLAVIVLLFTGGDDEIDFEVPPPTSAPLASESTTTTSTEVMIDPDRPDIGPLNCARLLDEDVVDVALFADPTGRRGIFTFAQGETCRYEPDEGESFVGLEPGDPSDFDEDAIRNGVSGEPVDGVGRAARWFDDPDAGVGVLAVGTPVDIGSLFYRIQVGRPDLDGPARLDVARTLALDALGRFPFVTLPKPELEVFTFDDEPPDLPPLSLDEVLFDGVENDEWTLGEGLVAVLGALVDGTTEERFGDLPEPSATWVIATAREYLEEPDAENAGEVTALLDELVPSTEELEAAPVPAEGEAAGGVALMGLAQETEDACPSGELDNGKWQYFNQSFGSCLWEDFRVGDELFSPGKYRLVHPREAVWDGDEITLAGNTLIAAAAAFEDLGAMPPTRLVLTPPVASNETFAIETETGCQVFIPPGVVSDERWPQIATREIAGCFVYENHPGLVDWPWLRDGLVEYLSGVALPPMNREHVNLPWLRGLELWATMANQRATNWIFFEHATALVGAQGVIDLISALPTDPADPVAAFAELAPVADLHHDLGRALSDADVLDVSAVVGMSPGATVPYDPPSQELALDGPWIVPIEVPQLGTRRIHITVPPGRYACIDTVFNEGDVRMSWRPGAPGPSGGSWSSDIPEAVEGEVTMVLTAVQEGATYTFEVVDVGDDPNCEPDEDDGPDDPADFACPELCEPSRFFRNALDAFFDLLED